MEPQDNQNKAKSRIKKQDSKKGSVEEQKTDKSRDDYIRIGILVAIIMIAAIAAAIYVDSPKSCSSVVFATQRNSCFAAEAAATGNSTMCHSISSQPLQQSCLESVAYSTKNASVCTSISNGSIADSCISNLSVATGNEALCSGIANSSSRSECLYSFAEAKNFSDVSYCSGISNSADYKNCTSSSQYVLAMKTGNPSYCSEMNNTPGNGVPTTNLLGLLPQNQSSKLSSSSIVLLNASNADVCYYSVAVSSGNISACSDIYSPISATCEYYVKSTTAPKQALNLSEVVSKCDEAGIYGGSTTINACIIGFAVSYENTTYCSQITNSSTKSICVSEVASRKANSST